MVERTDEERLGAIDSMFRIRGVESPPDERGARTIWHRGVRGAELVTDVDAQGLVTRQELVLFDDLIVWTSTAPLRTGQVVEGQGSKAARPSDGVTFDLEASAALLARVARPLRRYSGDDRYLQHARKIVMATQGQLFGDPGEVTRAAPDVKRDWAIAEALRREQARKSDRSRQLAIVSAVLLAAAVLGVAAWLLLS